MKAKVSDSRLGVTTTTRMRLAMAIVFGLMAESPTVFAKDVPGTTKTAYNVSQNGTFSFQVPIVIPTGTNGMHPNIGLGYNSEGGNGALGVGWGISGLSSITRCGKSIATEGERSGVFHNQDDRLCLDGRKLLMVHGTYGTGDSEYRAEIDEISKIVASTTTVNNANGGVAPEYFTVMRKDGSIRIYGGNTSTTNSQFKLGSGSVHAWKLSRVLDRHGNYYEITYRPADGLPDHIDYTGNDDHNLSADKKVDFVYGARTDKRTQYVAGEKISRDVRLTEINVTKGGFQTRRYEMAYLEAPTSKKSRLSSITECGTNDGTGEECVLQPIKIDWKTETAGFRPSSGEKEVAEHALIGFDADEDNSEITYGEWADVNGDGHLDQVIAVTLPGSSTPTLLTYIKTGDTWTEDANWRLDKPLRDYYTPTTNDKYLTKVINQGRLIDVNGDGLVDVVYAYVRADNPNLNNYAVQVKEIWINNGVDGFDESEYTPPDFLYSYVDTVNQIGGGGNNPQYQVKEVVRGQLVDINGDGYVDWMQAYQNVRLGYEDHSSTWINNGPANGVGNWTTIDTNNPAGWTLDGDYALPDVFAHAKSYVYTVPHGQLIDVNGDGLLDWLQSYKHAYPTDPTISNVWINTGTGWDDTDSADFELPEHIYEPNGGHNTGTIVRGSFVDVNGDGLRDWVRSYASYSYTVSDRAVRLNTGKGWTGTGSNHHGYAPEFVHLNHGKTGTSGTPWPVQRGGYYVDINRDGLVDYSESYKDYYNVEHKNTWINTGTSWVKENTLNPGWLYFDYSLRDQAKIRYGDFIDINGDASVDWVKSRLGNIGTRTNKLGKIDIVSRVTTTMGVEVKPSFVTLISDENVYTKYPIDPADPGALLQAEENAYFMAAPICVVAELAVTNGNGSGDNVTQYSYAGAQIHRQGRGYLGFHSRTVTDVQKGIVQYSRFSQTFPFTGMTVETVVRDSSTGHSLNEVQNALAIQPIAHVIYPNAKITSFPYVSHSIVRSRETSGTLFRTVNSTMKYDNYGNLIEQHRITKDGLGATVGDAKQTPVYYTPNTTNWLVGLKEYDVTLSKATHSEDSDVTRTNQYEYTAEGRLEITTREPNTTEPNIKLFTVYQYDDFGNIESHSETSMKPTPASNLDANARTNSIGYDAQHRLPANMTNPMGHNSSIVYDPLCDLPKTTTDANGLEADFKYDGFCRQTEVTDVADVLTTTIYNSALNAPLNCDDCPTILEFNTISQTEGAASVKTHVNRYLQPILTTTTGMLGEDIKQESKYDIFGRTSSTSLPYFDNDIDSTYWRINTYDILDRVTQTELLDGEISIQSSSQAYSIESGRQKVLQIDAEGETKTSHINAIGQTEKIVDSDNNQMIHRYNSHGLLAQTTDALNNSITITYDEIGRRIGLNDPDMGVSEYKHNAFGEVTDQEDAKDQTMTMGYDKLGRMTTRIVPGVDGGGTSIFTFDTQPNGIGSPATITGPGGYSKSFSYDEFSRPSGNITTIKGTGFSQSLTYDEYGRLATRTYPESGTGNPFQVEYHYQNGYLSSISGKEDQNGFCIEHWRANKYDALGRTKNDTLGTIVTTDRVYDQARGFLKRIVATVDVNQVQSIVQDLEYEYDNVGNVDTRTDHVSGLSESFMYDKLHRLESYGIGANTVSVLYDEIGNIKQKSDVGVYDYTGQGGPHAVSKITTDPVSYDPLAKFQKKWVWNGEEISQAQNDIVNADYQYDPNGNIKVQGSRVMTWTAFNKPSSMMVVLDPINGSRRGSVLEYGAQFERVYKQEGTYNLTTLDTVKESTIYIGKDYERITDDNGTRHRYMISTGSGTVQIEREDGTNLDKVKYLLADSLGSTNVVLNSEGEIVQKFSFDPWGMHTNAGDTQVNKITNKGYTGHEMDDEVGLANMNARIYDPYLGRFLSADSMLPDASDMQQYNRYSYVVGNPLKYVDPTGHQIAPSGCQSLHCQAGFRGPRPFRINFGFRFGGRLGRYINRFQSAVIDIDRIVAGVEALAHLAGYTELETARAIQNGINSLGGGDRRYGISVRGSSSSRSPTDNGDETETRIGLTSAINYEGRGIRVDIGYTPAYIPGTDIETESRHTLVIFGEPGSDNQIAVRAGLNVILLEGERGLFNEDFADKPTELLARQHVGYIDATMEEILAHVDLFILITNRGDLIYGAGVLPGQNSNSFSFTLIESLGFDRPLPILPATGAESGTIIEASDRDLR